MSSRTSDIIARLEASGMMTSKGYTHEQLLDEMKGFERAALGEVFREGYSDSLRTYDLITHFRDMASQYGLDDTEVFGRLVWALQKLSGEIGALVNGARGEFYMARALRWLTCPNEVLLNVELEFEGERCEYDAIVISPSGINIVESKFCNHDAEIDEDGFFHDRNCTPDRCYNVGEKIRAKEHVLFNVLENASPGIIPRSCIRSVFFVANNRVKLDNRFGVVDVCNAGQICPLIESRDGEVLCQGARGSIAASIEWAAESFLYEPDIDFDQLRSDIADFIVMVERASARSEANEEKAVEAVRLEAFVVDPAQTFPARLRRMRDIARIAAPAAVAAAMCALVCFAKRGM